MREYSMGGCTEREWMCTLKKNEYSRVRCERVVPHRPSHDIAITNIVWCMA